LGIIKAQSIDKGHKKQDWVWFNKTLYIISPTMETIVPILQAIFLGFVQGATEFLPSVAPPTSKLFLWCWAGATPV
jgi:hypothetical protein